MGLPGTSAAAHDGDGPTREFARIMVAGACVGVMMLLLVASLLARFAGLERGEAFATAVWPAVVGGPFFGVTFGMARRFARMDASIAPARPSEAAPQDGRAVRGAAAGAAAEQA